MAHSAKEGKSEILDLIKERKHLISSVLDVGAGSGTYLKLLKTKFGILDAATWCGIEAWQQNITDYDLKSRYDTIFEEDVREFKWGNNNFDLIIFGDILEHMTKDESQKVIAKAISHSKFIIISIPIIHYPQDDIGGNPFEVHVKDDWTYDEVLSSFPNITYSWKGNVIGVFLIES